jgi:ketosteroid isomerase-like protein
MPRAHPTTPSLLRRTIPAFAGHEMGSGPIAIALVLVLAGCAGRQEPRPAAAPIASPAARPMPAAAPVPAMPPSGVTRAPATAPAAAPAYSSLAPPDEAQAADRAFSAALGSCDAGAFLGLVSADAVFLGSRATVGRAAVGVAWSRFLAADGPRLSWAPEEALAAGSGDVVMTRGRASFRASEGAPEQPLRYLTVWRRDADGRLRAALDGSDTPLPALPAGVARRPLKSLVSADGSLAAEAGLLVDGGGDAGQYLLVRRRDGGGWKTLADVGRLGAAAN